MWVVLDDDDNIHVVNLNYVVLEENNRDDCMSKQTVTEASLRPCGCDGDTTEHATMSCKGRIASHWRHCRYDFGKSIPCSENCEDYRSDKC